jgi:Sulfotransferase domain
MRENRKVDFLIVGTQKGGTTALSAFLRQHPQIFIPRVKEAHFFDMTRKYLADVKDPCPYVRYHELFEIARPGQLWGEATPIYMFLPFVADRIFHYNPTVKLIFLLRNPVERAYSAYKMERTREWDRWPFILAVVLEPFRLQLALGDLDDMQHPLRVSSYLSRGFYSKQVQRFVRMFPLGNCLFIKSEELLGEHESVMRRIFGFLGVDPDVQIPAARISPDIKAPAAQGSFRLASMPNPLLARVLALLYRRDRARLKRLTGMEFCDWG